MRGDLKEIMETKFKTLEDFKKKERKESRGMMMTMNEKIQYKAAKRKKINK